MGNQNSFDQREGGYRVSFESGLLPQDRDLNPTTPPNLSAPHPTMGGLEGLSIHRFHAIFWA